MATQNTGRAAPKYALGASAAEQERLVLQAKMFEAEAAWLLDRTGIGAGGHAVDIGCGPLGVLDRTSSPTPWPSSRRTCGGPGR